MKKILLLLSLMAVMPLYNKMMAQCTVSNVVVSNIVVTPIGVDSLRYTIDLQFDGIVNGGNKDIWLHMWKETDYPSLSMQAYNCTGQQSVGPAPSTFTQANTHLDVLDKAFLTFGFDANTVTTGTPGTAGIYTVYHYDPAVTTNYQGATIYKITHPLDPNVGHVYVQNLSFKVAKDAVIDFLQVRAFNWSTEGDQRPQCWGCGETFIIGDPLVSGSVNCTTPRTFNLNIQSKFDDLSVPGIETITGFYQLFIDVNRSGTIDVGTDILAQTSTAFTTSVDPLIVRPGFKSAYLTSVHPFNNYIFNSGDTNSNKPLIALVNVTTPGYLGAGTTGILVNPCSVLPVTITNFSASNQTNAISLTWETAQEFNFYGFDVQRKIGKGSFASIGFVNASAAEGGSADYQFADAVIPSGEVLLYRLRIVEKDGSFTYSDIKAIRNNSNKMYVTIHPNPSNGTVNVVVPLDAGVYDVILTDYLGKTLKTMSGLKNQSLQLNNLRAGIYMLKVNFRETGESITERVIVQ